MTSKAYSFKCKSDDERKNKLQGVFKSQLIQIKFEEFKKCLDGEYYQKDCDNYIIKSPNQEMYLQQIKKINIVLFDEKRCYIYIIERIPWE